MDLLPLQNVKELLRLGLLSPKVIALLLLFGSYMSCLHGSSEFSWVINIQPFALMNMWLVLMNFFLYLFLSLKKKNTFQLLLWVKWSQKNTSMTKYKLKITSGMTWTSYLIFLNYSILLCQIVSIIAWRGFVRIKWDNTGENN